MATGLSSFKWAKIGALAVKSLWFTARNGWNFTQITIPPMLSLPPHKFLPWSINPKACFSPVFEDFQDSTMTQQPHGGCHLGLPPGGKTAQWTILHLSINMILYSCLCPKTIINIYFPFILNYFYKFPLLKMSSYGLKSTLKPEIAVCAICLFLSQVAVTWLQPGIQGPI